MPWRSNTGAAASKGVGQGRQRSRRSVRRHSNETLRRYQEVTRTVQLLVRPTEQRNEAGAKPGGCVTGVTIPEGSMYCLFGVN